METTSTELAKGSPAHLLQLAIENKADIQQLEKLMDLQDRWNAGLAKKSFLAAISNFQNDVPEIKKTKTVDYGAGKAKYKFADIADIDKAIKAPMKKNGLSKRWEVKDETDKLIVTCIISHVDGHSETTTMSAPKDTSPGKNEIQMRASAITYLKRYTMTSALGITTADDDVDGVTKKQETKQEVPQSIKDELLLMTTVAEFDKYCLKNCKEFLKVPEFRNYSSPIRKKLAKKEASTHK